MCECLCVSPSVVMDTNHQAKFVGNFIKFRVYFLVHVFIRTLAALSVLKIMSQTANNFKITILCSKCNFNSFRIRELLGVKSKNKYTYVISLLGNHFFKRTILFYSVLVRFII